MSLSATIQASFEQASLFAFNAARELMDCRAAGDRMAAAGHESDIVRAAEWIERSKAFVADRGRAPILRTVGMRSTWDGKSGVLICHYLTSDRKNGLRIEVMLWDEGMPELRLVAGSDGRGSKHALVVYVDEQYTREEIPGEIDRLRAFAARHILALAT